MKSRNMEQLVNEYYTFSDSNPGRGITFKEFNQVLRLTHDKPKHDSIMVAMMAAYMAGTKSERNHQAKLRREANKGK